MGKIFKDLLLLSACFGSLPSVQASEATMETVQVSQQRNMHIPVLTFNPVATLEELAKAFNKHSQEIFISPKLPLIAEEVEQVSQNYKILEMMLDLTAQRMENLSKQYGWSEEMEVHFGPLVRELRAGILSFPSNSLILRLAQITPEVLQTYYYSPFNPDEKTAIRTDDSKKSYEEVSKQIAGLRSVPDIDLPNGSKTTDLEMLILWKQDQSAGYNNVMQIFNAHKIIKENGSGSPFTNSLAEVHQKLDKIGIVLNKGYDYFLHRERLLSYLFFAYPNPRPQFVSDFLLEWMEKTNTLWRSKLALTSFGAIESLLKVAILNGWSPNHIGSIAGLSQHNAAMALQHARNPQIKAIFEPTNPLPPLTAQEVINAFMSWFAPLETTPKSPPFREDYIGIWADYQMPELKRKQLTQGIFDLEPLGMAEGLMEMLEKYPRHFDHLLNNEEALLKAFYKEDASLKGRIDNFEKEVFPPEQSIKSDTLENAKGTAQAQGDQIWWELEKSINLLSAFTNNIMADHDFYEIQTYFHKIKESKDQSVSQQNVRRLRMASLYGTAQLNAPDAFIYLMLVKISYVKPFKQWHGSKDETYRSYLERLQKLAPRAYQVALRSAQHRLAAYVILNEARQAEEKEALLKSTQELSLADKKPVD